MLGIYNIYVRQKHKGLHYLSLSAEIVIFISGQQVLQLGTFGLLHKHEV